jgi:hypothetical protein
MEVDSIFPYSHRFWSNNKSRIYLLEHAADLIQSRGLVPGDSILFYRADDGHLVSRIRGGVFSRDSLFLVLFCISEWTSKF